MLPSDPPCPEQLFAFAHATLFSPALSTLTLALDKGYLVNFPGLSTKLLHRHPPCSYSMVKGHLDQSRQGQRSTQRTMILSNDPGPTATNHAAADNDAFPTSPADHECTPFCYATIMEPPCQIYTNQTGRFVTQATATTIF
jgi:hypothetical protein